MYVLRYINFFFYYLQAVPETINEDFCGIEPVTIPPEEDETRRPPDVDEEAIKHYYSATNPILGTVLAIIFLILVIIGVGIFKQKNRHKGEYLTREDEGAHDAFDADTAVLQVLFFSVKSQRSTLNSMIFTNFLPFFCRDGLVTMLKRKGNGYSKKN